MCVSFCNFMAQELILWLKIVMVVAEALYMNSKFYIFVVTFSYFLKLSSLNRKGQSRFHLFYMPLKLGLNLIVIC